MGCNLDGIKRINYRGDARDLEEEKRCPRKIASERCRLCKLGRENAAVSR